MEASEVVFLSLCANMLRALCDVIGIPVGAFVLENCFPEDVRHESRITCLVNMYYNKRNEWTNSERKEYSGFDNWSQAVKLRNLAWGVDSSFLDGWSGGWNPYRRPKCGRCKTKCTLLDFRLANQILVMTISTSCMRQKSSMSFSAASWDAEFFSVHLDQPPV